ncbi:MAG: hypothetical protein QM783_17650 [Phycisphaerales bacterium]
MLTWSSIIGLALILATAVFSLFAAVSYREDTYGIANRVLLWRGSVYVVYRPGPDKVMLTGIEAFEAGWSITRFVPWGVDHRWWRPEYSYDNGTIGRFWIVNVPLWIPAAVCGGGVWWGRRLSRRFEKGACGACGYDVRGVVGGACPECGKAVMAASRG